MVSEPLLQTEGNIFLQRIREQEVILGHIGHRLPHVPDGYGVDVVAVQKHGAVGHVAGA